MDPSSDTEAKLEPTSAEESPEASVENPLAAASVETPLAASRTALTQVPKSEAPVHKTGASTGGESMTTDRKDRLLSPSLPPGKIGGVASLGKVNNTWLRHFFTALLVEHPKGMSIQALNRAFAEAHPDVVPEKKQVEDAIKAIASYVSPGKYMLKKEVDIRGFAKASPGSGSSSVKSHVVSPAVLANFKEARNETGDHVDSDATKCVAKQEEATNAAGSSRQSTLPVQTGSQSAESRAVKKARTEMEG